MIEQYQGSEVVGATRFLYEEVFTEDSRDFIEYYYTHKVHDTTAYVVKIADCIEAMVHLNPFVFTMKGNQWREEVICYLVAVATREASRHQGYMDSLLKRAMMELREQKSPFLILMPANPKIYEPYGFTYMTQKVSCIPKAEIVQGCNSVKVEELDELIQLSTTILAQQHTCYVKRDRAYYERVLLELAAQKGTIYWLKNRDNKKVGYCYYEPIEQSVQEFGLLEEELVEDYFTMIQGAKPQMMGRILCVESIGNWFALEQGVEIPVDLILRIEDELLLENQGYYHWNITSSGSVVKAIHTARVSEMDYVPIFTFTITQLTQLLFGQFNIGEITIQNACEFALVYKKIRRKMDIFFQEVV